MKPDFSCDASIYPVPDAAACTALHERYATYSHIREHCRMVSEFATALAERAVERGRAHPSCVALTRAGGLLHDLAKTYCINHGGSHAQMGASWVLTETGNPRLAQIVLYHVEWKETLPDNLCQPVFFVNYADKRIRHEECVTLDERYADLLVRYNFSERSRQSVRNGHALGLILERALGAQLEWPIHACTLAGGRLVS